MFPATSVEEVKPCLMWFSLNTAELSLNSMNSANLENVGNH